MDKFQYKPQSLFPNSYTRSRDRPGKTQQTGIFCGKSFIAYIFRSKKQEPEQESKSSIAYIFRSKRARVQALYCLHLQEPESKRARERKRTRKQERENGKTPSLLRRIILRLGRITPWLAAAHRPSCHHGKGRTHGGKTAPARVQIMFTT